jgi:quercetin dioxygenase-like cupin family protein
MKPTTRTGGKQMVGKFLMARDTRPEELNWGRLGWISNPPKTGAEQLTVIEITLTPGKGHGFHRHQKQEQVTYVIAGTVEFWIKHEKRTLSPGDSAFVPTNTVHAFFNRGIEETKLITILGPCDGPIGYEFVDVGDEAPWKSIRKV